MSVDPFEIWVDEKEKERKQTQIATLTRALSMLIRLERKEAWMVVRCSA